MEPIEAAWLAGLLEGEGSFGWAPTKNGKLPLIQLMMTDWDVVRKAATLMGIVTVGAKSRPPRKDIYRARVQGAKAIDIMLEIRPLMGNRRGARIDEIVTEYQN